MPPLKRGATAVIASSVPMATTGSKRQRLPLSPLPIDQGLQSQSRKPATQIHKFVFAPAELSGFVAQPGSSENQPVYVATNIQMVSIQQGSGEGGGTQTQKFKWALLPEDTVHTLPGSPATMASSLVVLLQEGQPQVELEKESSWLFQAAKRRRSSSGSSAALAGLNYSTPAFAAVMPTNISLREAKTASGASGSNTGQQHPPLVASSSTGCTQPSSQSTTTSSFTDLIIKLAETANAQGLCQVYIDLKESTQRGTTGKCSRKPKQSLQRLEASNELPLPLFECLWNWDPVPKAPAADMAEEKEEVSAPHRKLGKPQLSNTARLTNLSAADNQPASQAVGNGKAPDAATCATGMIAPCELSTSILEALKVVPLSLSSHRAPKPETPSVDQVPTWRQRLLDPVSIPRSHHTVASGLPTITHQPYRWRDDKQCDRSGSALPSDQEKSGIPSGNLDAMPSQFMNARNSDEVMHVPGAGLVPWGSKASRSRTTRGLDFASASGSNAVSSTGKDAGSVASKGSGCNRQGDAELHQHGDDGLHIAPYQAGAGKPKTGQAAGGDATANAGKAKASAVGSKTSGNKCTAAGAKASTSATSSIAATRAKPGATGAQDGGGVGTAAVKASPAKSCSAAATAAAKANGAKASAASGKGSTSAAQANTNAGKGSTAKSSANTAKLAAAAASSNVNDSKSSARRAKSTPAAATDPSITATSGSVIGRPSSRHHPLTMRPNFSLVSALSSEQVSQDRKMQPARAKLARVLCKELGHIVGQDRLPLGSKLLACPSMLDKAVTYQNRTGRWAGLVIARGQIQCRHCRSEGTISWFEEHPCINSQAHHPAEQLYINDLDMSVRDMCRLVSVEVIDDNMLKCAACKDFGGLVCCETCPVAVCSSCLERCAEAPKNCTRAWSCPLCKKEGRKKGPKKRRKDTAGS